jgi:AcrR family transcriptional regulator
MAQVAPQPDTRARILDAAELLFLEKGFRGASLRALTTAAGVNLAAVGYHFGSKDELLCAVLERRIEPVNRERLRRLDAVEARWRRGEPRALEPILAALLEPAFAAMRADGESRDIATLLYSEPHERMPQLIERLFGECARRFHAAVSRVLGRADPSALALRFQMVIGAMLHFLGGRHRLSPKLLGVAVDDSERAVLDELIAFLAAGLRAPARRKSGARRPVRAEESLR